MSEEIRVLIADDHTVVRGGLVALLEDVEGIQVIAEAGDGIEAVLKARSVKPDVILMDLMMPRMTGIEATEEIKRENPNARILVLTSFDDDGRVSGAIKAGALGFLRKDASPDDLFVAIRNTAKGASYLPQEIVQKLIRDLQHPGSPASVGAGLTDRELDVLAAIAKGMSNQEIANTLYIGTTTVRTHVRNVLRKLGVANRTQAALCAVKSGLAHEYA